ncbi:MAG: HlyD family efflux transporter periplasmic adaptor subunit [Pseudomonadota bacterium]
MLKKLLKIFLPIIILGSSFTLAWYLYKTKSQKPVVEIVERTWRVETITAVAGNYSPSIILYGKVEAPELYNSSAPAFGRLLELHVKEGQKVTKNQLLAKMDEADFLPALKMVQAKVVSFDAQINNEKLRNQLDKNALKHQQELLVLGRQSLKRTQEVRKQNLASQAEADDAKKIVLQQQLAINTLKLSLEGYSLRLKSLYASRDQAVAEMDKAALSLARGTFNAPFDGIIASVNVAVGDQLSSGENLFSLYPLNHLEIRSKIPFQFKQRIEKALSKGQELTAYAPQQSNIRSKQQFKLLRLSGLESASGVDVFFEISNNAEQLRPGSFLQLRLILPSSEPLFSAPYSALYGKDKLYKIVADNDNLARMKSIKITPEGEYIREDQRSNSNDNQNHSLLLFSSRFIKPGDQIVITHLPNALNGLKVNTVNK